MPPMVLMVLEGVLLTYSGSAEIGREKYRDDGKTLASEVELAGQKFAVSVQRAPRKAVLTVGEKRIEHEVPAGTVVLANGAWQEYALAAEWFPNANKTPVKVLLPGATTIDGLLTVAPFAGGKRVEVAIGALTVVAEVSAAGAVTHATVAAQGLEVRPAGAAPPAVTKRALPPGIAEEPVEVERSAVKLRGTLWRPAAAKGKLPLALLIAGSGPTDRDGNSALGLRTDTYRMIAEGLARAGVATVRFDKRGVGESPPTFDPAKVVLDDFVADTAALLSHARKDKRFQSITLIGHSEGALIATLVAKRERADGLILLAGPGRPAAVLLREQLSRQLDAKGLAELDRVTAALRAGQPIDPLPPSLAPLFPPAVRAFWRSELDVDPAGALKDLKLPTLIVQGENDAQVTVEDARKLAAVRPDAKLLLLPRANHLFKEEASRALPQASYHDPSRPLVPGLIDALVAALLSAPSSGTP